MQSPKKGRAVTVLSSNYKIASQDVRTFLVEKVRLIERFNDDWARMFGM